MLARNCLGCEGEALHLAALEKISRGMPQAAKDVFFAPTTMKRNPFYPWLLLSLVGGWSPVAGQDAALAPYRPPSVSETPLVAPLATGSQVLTSSLGQSSLSTIHVSTPACIECMPATTAAQASGLVTAGPYGWRSRILPEGLIWHSDLAGVHVQRISGIVFADHDGTPFLDVVLGGRMAVWRYGTDSPVAPQGYELQIEGAALPRLNLDQFWDLEAVDFRFGVPLVGGNDRWQWKAGYYHLSAHLGDELAAREGILAERINYSRDVLHAGLSFYPLPAWRWYTEAGWAFYTDGGAEPWEFQFGVDIATPGPTGPAGIPFAAVNGHLREEVDFGGSLTVQAGWLWRGNSGRALRTGVHYYNGKSSQYQFFDFFEEQIGAGLWGEF